MSEELNMESAKKMAEPVERHMGRIFALIFFVLAAGIAIAGWFYYQNIAQNYRAEA